MKPVYTVDEVAFHLKKSSRTVRNWIATGKLPAKKVGRGYLITEEAVSYLVEPRSEAARGETTASAPGEEVTLEMKAGTREMLRVLTGADREAGTAAILAARERERKRLAKSGERRSG